MDSYVNDPSRRPYAELNCAAIAINASGRHVGVIFRRDDGVGLLHLAFHHSLRLEVPHRYFWMEVILDPFVQELVAPLCELIAARYCEAGLAYSVAYEQARFELTTGNVVMPRGRGFTCATFVLAMFASVGCDLLACEEWEAREGDASWHAEIVELLEQHNAAAEHIEAERRDIGCVRFRPAEVACAGISYVGPVGFRAAERRAAELLALLRESKR